MEKIKAYYSLTKPGLIRGNIVLVAAGFLFASHLHFSITIFFITMVGVALVIASGCVFNNYIDRHIDKDMERTKDRALVTGKISDHNALTFAFILGVAGIALLFFFTNSVVTILAFIGIIFYVLLYSPIKHRSVHAALVGSVAGATPIVMGYCAVSGRFDAAAALLFLILVFWQMPHFYAIAIYRLNDYSAASVPVYPVKNGLPKTKRWMFVYIIVFTVCTILLWYFGYKGIIFLSTSMAMCALWLCLSFAGFWTNNPTRWARHMFFLSLLVLMVISIALALHI